MLKSKLTEDEVSDVQWVIDTCFNYIADISDAKLLSDAVLQEVVEDIEETADNERFNASDVRMALTRVLKKRLGVEG